MFFLLDAKAAADRLAREVLKYGVEALRYVKYIASFREVGVEDITAMPTLYQIFMLLQQTRSQVTNANLLPSPSSL